MEDKIIQITGQGGMIYALTQSGKIFRYSFGSWEEIKLPTKEIPFNN